MQINEMIIDKLNAISDTLKKAIIIKKLKTIELWGLKYVSDLDIRNLVIHSITKSSYESSPYSYKIWDMSCIIKKIEGDLDSVANYNKI